jgi:hypothetical protein
MKQNIYSSQNAASKAQKLLCFYFKKIIRLQQMLLTSESPKRIVTTVYNLYCSYYPFR